MCNIIKKNNFVSKPGKKRDFIFNPLPLIAGKNRQGTHNGYLSWPEKNVTAQIAAIHQSRL